MQFHCWTNIGQKCPTCLSPYIDKRAYRYHIATAHPVPVEASTVVEQAWEGPASWYCSPQFKCNFGIKLTFNRHFLGIPPIPYKRSLALIYLANVAFTWTFLFAVLAATLRCSISLLAHFHVPLQAHQSLYIQLSATTLAVRGNMWHYVYSL